MGNTHSAEALQRSPNKLSKPKTNTSTPNLLGSSSNLLASACQSQAELKTVSKKPSFISTKGTVTADGDGEVQPVPIEKRPRRLGLFRSKSANTKPTSVPLPDPTDPHQRMPNLEHHVQSDPLRRYSQRIFENYEISGEAQYLRHDTQAMSNPLLTSATNQEYRRSVTASKRPTSEIYSIRNPRLSLAVETKPIQSADAEMTQEEPSGTSSVDYQRSPLSPSPQETLDIPKTADIPIRRRSLQTPGIATRHSWAKETMRKPVASQQDLIYSQGEKILASSQPYMPKPVRAQTMPAEDRMPDYRQSMVSNLSFPALQGFPVELESPIIAEVPDIFEARTATPNDLEYRYIGTHQLGSLRITNGSPAPDSGDEASIHRGRREDSVGAAPAHSTLKHTGAIRSKQSRSSLNQHEEASNEPASTVLVGVEPDKQTHNVSVAELYGDEPPCVTKLRLETSYESLRLFNFHHTQSASLQVHIDPNSPTRANEMARAYMAQIASSPFSLDGSPPSSPHLEPTTKHTAHEDHLFDDELDSVTTPHSGGSDLMPRSQYFSEVPSSFDTFVVDKARLSRWSMELTVHSVEKNRPEQPGRSDSGYNSNTSLSVRSSTKSPNTFSDHSTSFEADRAPERAAEMVPLVPDKEPPPTPPKDSTNNIPAESSEEMSVLLKFRQEVEEHLSTNIEQVGYSTTITLPPTGGERLKDDQSPVTPTKQKHSRGKSWTSLLGRHTDSKASINASAASEKKNVELSDSAKDLPNPLRINGLPPVPLRMPPPVPTKVSIDIQSTVASSTASEVELAYVESQPHLITQSQSMPVIGQALSTPEIDIRSPHHGRSGSDTSVSSVPNKLRKTRPNSQPSPISGPVTVQACYEIEADRVPAVPQGMMVALEDHLQKYPPLTQANKNLRRTNSKETLTTIFSVESAEILGQRDNASLFSRLDRSSLVIPSNGDIELRVNHPIKPFPIRSENVPIESIPNSKGEIRPSNSRPSSMDNKLHRSPHRMPGSHAGRVNVQGRNSLQTHEIEEQEKVSNDFYPWNHEEETQTAMEIHTQGIKIVGQESNTAMMEVLGRPANKAFKALPQIQDETCAKSLTGSRDDREQLPSRRISMDSYTASRFAREKSRAREGRRRSLTPRRSFGLESGFDGHSDLLSAPAKPNFFTEDVPPVPNLPAGQIRKATPIQKAKSPPPVTMATQRMPSPRKSQQNLRRLQGNYALPVGSANIMNRMVYHDSNFSFRQQKNLAPPGMRRPVIASNRRTSADQAIWPAHLSRGAPMPTPKPPFMYQQAQHVLPSINHVLRRRFDTISPKGSGCDSKTLDWKR